MPGSVEYVLGTLGEDEHGVYCSAVEHLFGLPREYLTLDDFRRNVRNYIEGYIQDLQRTASL